MPRPLNFRIKNTTIFMLYLEKIKIVAYNMLVKIVRTSGGGNGNHSVSLPIILIKLKSNASIFIYKLVVGLYFMILHLISYFHKCAALFLG